MSSAIDSNGAQYGISDRKKKVAPFYGKKPWLGGKEKNHLIYTKCNSFASLLLVFLHTPFRHLGILLIWGSMMPRLLIYLNADIVSEAQELTLNLVYGASMFAMLCLALFSLSTMVRRDAETRSK